MQDDARERTALRQIVAKPVQMLEVVRADRATRLDLDADKRAVVGTINLDYRSLYLHFENGVYLENVSEIKAMKKDFEDTFKDCKILEDKDVKTGIFKASWQAILRLFAPLL